VKAVVLENYGLPEKVLKLSEVDKPIAKGTEVLIKIRSTTINDYDWSAITGKPLFYRLLFGLLRPKNPISGMELSGIVEALGPNACKLEVGNEVYGDISAYGFGSFAEYICIDERAVILKPEEMSFEQAAAMPHASLLALQGLHDKGRMSQGYNILINGGGGGVGTYGLQLAKLRQCKVTGVDKGEKLEMMKSLGFDHVIDYNEEDFTKNGQCYDLILDCKSDKSPFSYLKALATGGRYVTIGGKLSSLIKILFLSRIISLFTSKKLMILALKPNEGLDKINALYAQKRIKCIIDGPYSMDEIPRLVQHFGDGNHKGKIVIALD